MMHRSLNAQRPASLLSLTAVLVLGVLTSGHAGTGVGTADEVAGNTACRLALLISPFAEPSFEDSLDMLPLDVKWLESVLAPHEGRNAPKIVQLFEQS